MSQSQKAIIVTIYVIGIAVSFIAGIKYMQWYYNSKAKIGIENVMLYETCYSNYITKIANRNVYESESTHKKYKEWFEMQQGIGESLCRDFLYNGMIKTPGWWNTEEYIPYESKSN